MIDVGGKHTLFFMVEAVKMDILYELWNDLMQDHRKRTSQMSNQRFIKKNIKNQKVETQVQGMQTLVEKLTH